MIPRRSPLSSLMFLAACLGGPNRSLNLLPLEPRTPRPLPPIDPYDLPPAQLAEPIDLPYGAPMFPRRRLFEFGRPVLQPVEVPPALTPERQAELRDARDRHDRERQAECDKRRAAKEARRAENRRRHEAAIRRASGPDRQATGGSDAGDGRPAQSA